MKKILFFAVITLFYACKTKEEVIPNRPPNAFTVTPTLKSDGKTITLNWTKAKDPDANAVTYTVVLKDTLVKNISDTTYTISNLDFNYSQTGKIIAKDAKGLKTEASFTAATKIVITFVSIPDANFEKALISLKIDKDGVLNGKMNADDAKGVITINVSEKSIKSLVGIEAFTDLQDLNCSYNELTSLDMSKNTNLQNLKCFYNYLTNIAISKNTNLKTLNCAYNNLVKLDISNNLNLQAFDCFFNELTSLDVTKNINLKNTSCYNNKLTSLDVSKNTLLEVLYCESNQLISLDVSKNIALKRVNCGDNQLKTLDVSKNINLNILDCPENQLTNLDISKNAVLGFMNCRVNQIKTICVADVAKAEANTDWEKDSTATYEVCK